MDLNEIQSLIKFVSRSGAEEVELETKDFKITIKAPPKGKRKKDEEQTQQVIHTQMPVMPQQMPQQMPVQQPAQQPQQPQQQPQQQETAEQKEEKQKQEDEEKYVTIKSPMIGTFYRRPSPDKEPFVQVGDTVKEGETTCVIEAMKLFNEIESEINGKIVKALVEDSSPVEYDQPLFLVDPS